MIVKMFQLLRDCKDRLFMIFDKYI
jgi:hypothetical protein